MMNGNIENNIHLSVGLSAKAMVNTYLLCDYMPTKSYGYCVP